LFIWGEDETEMLFGDVRLIKVRKVYVYIVWMVHSNNFFFKNIYIYIYTYYLFIRK
jgi:hypothetical protein